MKSIIRLLFLLLPFSICAQEKPVRYFDEHLNPVLKEECMKKEPNKYVQVFELDTATYYIKMLNNRRGKLTAAALDSLRADLESVTQAWIPSDHMMVVNYYPGPDPCNQSGTRDSKILKERFEYYKINLHKIAPISQVNIYEKPEGLEKYNGIITWRPDLNHRFQRTFFKFHADCGSFVVICPDGRFMASFGEYSYDYVLKIVKELKDGK